MEDSKGETRELSMVTLEGGQEVELEIQKYPGAQGNALPPMQKDPAGQSRGVVLPSGQCVPFRQGRGSIEPLGQTNPEGQGPVQLLLKFCVVDPYRPAGQGTTVYSPRVIEQ